MFHIQLRHIHDSAFVVVPVERTADALDMPLSHCDGQLPIHLHAKGVPQTAVDSFFRALVSTSTLQARSGSFDELKKRDRPFLLPKHPRLSISTKRRMYTRYLGTKSDSLRGRYRATWNSWLVDRLAYECLVTKQIAPRSVYSPRDVVGPLQCSMLKSSVDRGA